MQYGVHLFATVKRGHRIAKRGHRLAKHGHQQQNMDIAKRGLPIELWYNGVVVRQLKQYFMKEAHSGKFFARDAFASRNAGRSTCFYRGWVIHR